jgi:hypothetical protein
VRERERERERETEREIRDTGMVSLIKSLSLALSLVRLATGNLQPAQEGDHWEDG